MGTSTANIETSVGSGRQFSGLLYIVSLFLPQSGDTILIIYLLGIYQVFYTLMDGVAAVYVRV